MLFRSGLLGVVLDDYGAVAQFVQLGGVVFGRFVALVAVWKEELYRAFYAGGALAHEVDFPLPAGAERANDGVLSRKDAAGGQLEPVDELRRRAPLRLVVGAVSGHRLDLRNGNRELSYDAGATSRPESHRAPMLTRSRRMSLLQITVRSSLTRGCKIQKRRTRWIHRPLSLRP